MPACTTSLLDALPGCYLVFDRDLRVVAATDSFLRLAECERAGCVGTRLADLVSGSAGEALAELLEGTGPSFERVLAGGSPDQMPPKEWRERRWRRTNTAVTIGAGGAEYIVHAVEEIADSPRDGPLQQTARLQAMGSLAAGVVHEINNMMSTVVGVAQLLLTELSADDARRKDVAEIVKAGMRAAAVGRDFLMVGRRPRSPAPVVDVNEVVTELQPALSRMVGADRRLELHSPLRGIGVRADREQVEQILINLVANARDATATNGLITITCEQVQVADQSGLFVRMTVRDDGAGMTTELQSRVLEPFFTTKPPGEGTGLGLFLTADMARRRGGDLRIESAPGMGTAVIVTLPAQEFVRAPGLAPAAMPRAKGETVLVVEDEESVRTLIRRILESWGYVVLEAASGVEALEMLAAGGQPVSLVVTDVITPRTKVREFAAGFAARYPGVPLLFMSGYSRDYLERRGLLEQEVPYLQKPFFPEMLAAAVHGLLAAPGPASGPTPI